jgi:hypothetical protein
MEDELLEKCKELLKAKLPKAPTNNELNEYLNTCTLSKATILQTPSHPPQPTPTACLQTLTFLTQLLQATHLKHSYNHEARGPPLFQRLAALR